MSVQLRDGVETTTRQYTRTIPGLRTSLLIQRLAFYKCSFCLVPGQCNISSAWGPQKYCESTEDEAARTAEYGASTEYYDRTENNAESTEYSPAMMVNNDLDVAEHELSEASNPVQTKGMAQRT